MNDLDSISRDFKAVFSGQQGKNVLEFLKTFCLSDVRQTCFDRISDSQTAYNLGANSVYRQIIYQIERELGKQEITECITTTERTEL